MSGLSTIATLKQTVDERIARTDAPTTPIDLIWPHPKGHKLRHPRIDDDVDVGLRDDIVENGVRETVVVRLEEHGGVMRMALNDGSRRYNAGLAAQVIMRKSGSKHLDREGNLRVKFRVIRCDDAEFLRLRQAADSDPLKVDHSLRVLCDSVVQMAEHNLPADRILEVMPRTWTLKIVEVVSLLWHTASASLRKRCDTQDIPPGLLPEVLKAKAADRESILDTLLAAEVTSASGAKRTLNVLAKRAALEVVPDIDDDGLDAIGDEDGDGAGDGEDGGDASAGKGDSEKVHSGPAPKRVVSPRLPVKAPVERPSARLVKRVNTDVGAMTRVTSAQRAFALGASCTLDQGYAREHVVKMLDSVHPDAKAAIGGFLWRLGLFDGAVQKHLDATVISLIAGTAHPRKAEKGGIAKAPNKRAKRKQKK